MKYDEKCATRQLVRNNSFKFPGKGKRILKTVGKSFVG